MNAASYANNKFKLIQGASASAAMRDIKEGVMAYPAWLALGWLDIKHKYRRSVLGPIWITLTMVILIAAVGPLYGALLKLNLKNYIPYVAAGDIMWLTMSSIINDGCTAFTSYESLIRSVRLPASVYVLRVTWRSMIGFAHLIIAYIPFMIYLHIAPTITWFWIIPGALLLFIAAVPVVMLCGILCTRFRDLQPIIANVMQLAFFLTPIFWKPELLGNRGYIANFNPFHIFIELVRGPLLGYAVSPRLYVTALVITAALYLISLPVFIKYRARISMWV
jgi:lipopolysaccharide transport system permease protein